MEQMTGGRNRSQIFGVGFWHVYHGP